MSDQQQTLRLLATLREEIAAVRARQEELYEVLISYKDQVQDLQSTVIEKLEGLPKSPYIAGQLVPAPETIGGVDDFRQLLSTYLHQAPPGEERAPRDVVMDPPAEVKPEDIELEPSDDPPRRRGRQRSERIDPDLSRGPDRDVVPLDLEEPKKKKRRSRSRSRTKKKSKSTAKDD